MKDIPNSDIVIRENKWSSAPRVRQQYMDHWVDGKSVRIAAYTCASCNACFPDSGLRCIEDGPGVVCRECYVYGRRCKMPGCFEVAVWREDVCRDHLIIDSWDRKDALEEIACQRIEPAIDEQLAPGIEPCKADESPQN